jgi:hypothetical protein
MLPFVLLQNSVRVSGLFGAGYLQCQQVHGLSKDGSPASTKAAAVTLPPVMVQPLHSHLHVNTIRLREWQQPEPATQEGVVPRSLKTVSSGTAHLVGHAAVDLQDVAQRSQPTVAIGPHHIGLLHITPSSIVPCRYHLCSPSRY